jgi:uncharacterized OsmC-like protein
MTTTGKRDKQGQKGEKNESKIINGLDTKQVQGIIEEVKNNPSMVQATFYTNTSWKTGFDNESSIKDFELGKNIILRPRTFKVVGDHPPELLGQNNGPTSVELLLAALGHSLTSGWSIYGAVLGVPIEELRVQVDGNLDLQGMLMLPQPGAVRPGFQEIRAKYYLKSKADRPQIEQVKKMAEDLSPTRDSLRAVRFSSELIMET